MSMRAAVLLLFLVGCGGRYGGPATRPDGANMSTKTPKLKGGIAAAALPYHILDGRTGRELEEAAFWPRLSRARAVCVGEDHPNPHHHWVQLRVVGELAKRVPKTDQLALGLEMIQRPFQGVLDDYAAKRIDAAALRTRAGWEERWGYDWDLYGPTIDVAVGAGGTLLALNAAKELSKKISRQGLESLTPDEKALVPELKLDDVTHRAWFDALMNDMGGHAAHGQPKGHGQGDKTDDDKKDDNKDAAAKTPAMPSADRIYTVQVLWDETMADLGAKWLAAHPSGHLVILAGNGHCHDSAIVNRLKRRGVTDVVSIRPVIDVDGEVASVLAKPMNDYVWVLSMPKSAR